MEVMVWAGGGGRAAAAKRNLDASFVASHVGRRYLVIVKLHCRCNVGTMCAEGLGHLQDEELKCRVHF